MHFRIRSPNHLKLLKLRAQHYWPMYSQANWERDHSLSPVYIAQQLDSTQFNSTSSWVELLRYCKERHFSLLHHFRHRTKHRSRHFNHANYTNKFPVYFHFRFLQINANISHTHLIVVLHCYPSILAIIYVKTPILQGVIWYLATRTPIGSKPPPSDSPVPSRGRCV